MYAAFHPEFIAQQWHVFVSFLVITWVSCGIVLFANRIVPFCESLGGFFTIAGVFITIIVCAVMPVVNGNGHASNDFVWRTWVNSTGYSSNGLVFLLGMLNGAFAVGTPDITTHLAEEIPRYASTHLQITCRHLSSCYPARPINELQSSQESTVTALVTDRDF